MFRLTSRYHLALDNSPGGEKKKRRRKSFTLRILRYFVALYACAAERFTFSMRNVWFAAENSAKVESTLLKFSCETCLVNQACLLLMLFWNILTCSWRGHVYIVLIRDCFFKVSSYDKKMGFGQYAFVSHVNSTWLQSESFNSFSSTSERRGIFAVF